MPEQVTELLIALRNGERQALDALLPLIYEELHAMARRRVAAAGRHPTLDTTALVHEAYLKLFDRTRLQWNDRKHFFRVAALAMRQIVVDHARRRGAGKRGAGAQRVTLDESGLRIEDQAVELLELDEALARLAALNERLAQVVELRFYCGLGVEEVAELLEVDPRTVKRDWRKARALLLTELGG